MSDDELNRRNTVAVRQALDELTAKIYGLHERVNALGATVGTLSERMNALEWMVAARVATSIGRGPTAT